MERLAASGRYTFLNSWCWLVFIHTLQFGLENHKIECICSFSMLPIDCDIQYPDVLWQLMSQHKTHLFIIKLNTVHPASYDNKQRRTSLLEEHFLVSLQLWVYWGAASGTLQLWVCFFTEFSREYQNNASCVCILFSSSKHSIFKI